MQNGSVSAGVMWRTVTLGKYEAAISRSYRARRVCSRIVSCAGGTYLRDRETGNFEHVPQTHSGNSTRPPASVSNHSSLSVCVHSSSVHLSARFSLPRMPDVAQDGNPAAVVDVPHGDEGGRGIGAVFLPAEARESMVEVEGKAGSGVVTRFGALPRATTSIRLPTSAPTAQYKP